VFVTFKKYPEIPTKSILQGVATSTQNAAQQALIGGAISPSVFGNVSHPTTWW
jgi:hypothetical protein